MKKCLLIISVLLLNAAISLGTTHTIISVGFTFSPDSIAIKQGDTVVFKIDVTHTVVEVTKATWEANGNTPLSGGFSLPAGGGKLTGITVGTHYYVCGVHNAMGMKGIIVVKAVQGINNLSGKLITDIIIYPNPVLSYFNIDYSVKEITYINISLIDFTGKLISNYISEEQVSGTYRLNIDNAYTPGIYFIRFSDRKTTIFKKILIL